MGFGDERGKFGEAWTNESKILSKRIFPDAFVHHGTPEVVESRLEGQQTTEEIGGIILELLVRDGLVNEKQLRDYLAGETNE